MLTAIYYDKEEKKYSTTKTFYNEPTQLAVDTDTKVVYWKFYNMSSAVNDNTYVTADEHKKFNVQVGFMSPYIGENGKFCRLDDGKIIEIV